MEKPSSKGLEMLRKKLNILSAFAAGMWLRKTFFWCAHYVIEEDAAPPLLN